MNSVTSHLNLEWKTIITYALERENPDDTIQVLLEYLGKYYLASRSYVFEFHETPTFSNTYEWCSENMPSQIEVLQNESLFHIAYWVDSFKDRKPIIIEDVEEIRFTQPATYALLKTQLVKSVVIVPCFLEDKLIGFIGADNPDRNHIDALVADLEYVGSIISQQIKTRNLLEKAIFYQFHDPVTQFYNKNALHRDLEKTKELSSFGVISCIVSRFPNAMDVHSADLKEEYTYFEWYSVLKHVFQNFAIYQLSPDNVVILCEDISESVFLDKISILRDFTSRNSFHLLLGHFWSDKQPLHRKSIVENAKNAMPLSNPLLSSTLGLSKNFPIQNSSSPSCPIQNVQTSSLNNFIANNYFDLNSFFQSMSIGGLYPYFGDLSSDLWYISDSMKELLGFSSNIVVSLLKRWEDFIPYKEDLELYRNDVANIMSFKKDIHDLVYRIVDRDGNELWIRCFGLITWNSDRSTPLSFCGNVFRLNYAYIVDPLTNFPREKPALREIGKLQQINQEVSFLCFRLNGFSEINEIHGRNTANNLLKDIGSRILKTFDKQIQFYRLDGLRFLAIVPSDFTEQLQEFSEKIKVLVEDIYEDYSLPIRVPCSIGILSDVSKNASAQEIINDVMSVLEIARTTPEEIITHSEQTVRLHREKKQMVIDLSNDVENHFHNFRVVVQPIVSASDHKIVGGELLLRWQYEDTDISPMVFIPILEETKLILPVGRWVFDQAVRHCKRINTFNPDFFLDFNVSYPQINDNELLGFMENTLMQRDLPSNHLIMELTETQYNNNPLKLQDFVEECLKMGIQMALDDFGVGYSSLEMLLKYPARVVKLDRSLMKKMSDSKDISDFITSIVYACHKFGKLVCVEGVETEQELQIVTEAGCDFVQGFYFHKPMEVNDFYDLFMEN